MIVNENTRAESDWGRVQLGHGMNEMRISRDENEGDDEYLEFGIHGNENIRAENEWERI